MVKVGDLGSWVTGATPKTSNPRYFGGDVPFVTPSDIGWGGLLCGVERTLTQEGADSVRPVPAPSVLLVCIGTLGKVALADRVVTTNQQINALVPDLTKVSAEYAMYLFASERFRAAMLEASTATTVRLLNKSKLSQIRVPLPPLDEQKRIVAKLDAAMAVHGKLLDNLNKQDELTSTLSSSVAASAIAELTGPQAPLLEVATVDYGTRLTRKNDGGTKYPVYGGGGETFRTDSWNREDCYIVARFAMSEECVRFVGGKFFLNDSGLSVATSDEAVLQQDFLNAYLLARSAEIYALGRGTAQRNLDVPAFKAMPMPVPPHDEQRRFVEKIEGLRRLGNRLTALREEKRSSLSELNMAIVNSLLAEES